MLTPPAPEAAPEATKRSEAVFVADRLTQTPHSWVREVMYVFEGEEYQYGLESLKARTEEDARRILYAPKPNKELDAVFLRDVQLDMTRPH